MQNDFNFVAPYYDSLARLIFGNAIQNSQTWLLPFISPNATVLIIGGGTGYILTEMLQQTNCRKIIYLEASEKMLQLSKKRYENSPKNPATLVEFRLGNENALTPEETFGVIFTGFLLDLFPPEPLHQIMQKLYHTLKPNGLWLVADFEPKNATKFWQKSLLKVMVRFFKITANLQAENLPDLSKAMADFPLKLTHKQYFYHQLIFSGVYRKPEI